MPEFLPDWETIKEYIEAFGWVKGVFTIYFFGAQVLIYKLYSDRIKDRKEEIDRIAGDNREYRELFMKLLYQRLIDGED